MNLLNTNCPLDCGILHWQTDECRRNPCLAFDGLCMTEAAHHDTDCWSYCCERNSLALGVITTISTFFFVVIVVLLMRWWARRRRMKSLEEDKATQWTVSFNR